MDEILESMVLHGCSLAKMLEQNLPILANKPDILAESCEEIVSIFRNVKERVLYVEQMRVQEHAMGSLEARVIPGVGGAYAKRVDDLPESSEMKGMLLHDPRRQLGLELMFGETGGGVLSGGVSGNSPSLDFAAATSSQRQGRRKNESDKVVKRVAAPQMGNTDTPPEDGFIWKKYGQKEILGHTYPRSYYRCSQQKLHDCPAKKQVQRLDYDPFVFEITYRNNHTCRVSSAAPVLVTPSTTAPPPSLPRSLMPINIFHQLGGVPDSSAGSSGGGGQFNDFQPVADMADAMFNSRSRSSNSMDLIFSSLDDHKWDSTGEKKDA